MRIATLAKRTVDGLNVGEALSRLSCPHRLASVAATKALHHGVVLNPVPQNAHKFLQYDAVRPVAPYTGGLRTSGFAASAAWGASFAVSAARTDGPIMWLHYQAHLFVTAAGPYQNLPAAIRRGADLAQGPEALPPIPWRRVLPYLPLVFNALEFVLGSGISPEDAEAEHGLLVGDAAPTVTGALHLCRRIGMLGYLEHLLLHRASTANLTGEILCSVSAVSLRLGLLPPRLLCGTVMASVAAAGALVGVVVELVAQMGFRGHQAYLQAAGLEARVVPLGVVVAEENRRELVLQPPDTNQVARRLVRAIMQPVDGAMLVGAEAAHQGLDAELIAAIRQTLFNMRPVHPAAPAEGYAVAGAAPLAPAAVLEAAPPAPAPVLIAAPPAPAAPRDAGQLAAYARGVDVHANGRDPATRAALARLRVLYPVVDEASSLQRLQDFIRAQEALPGAFAGRVHPCGVTPPEAALMALGIRQDVGQHSYEAILGNQRAIRLDDGSSLPITLICATVWYAIENLVEGDGRDAGATERLRAERKEAFVLALADIVTRDRVRVCGPGKAQRMVITLQGFVPGIEVEAYERVPTVGEFITYTGQQLQVELGDEPQPEVLRRAFDRVYADGVARLNVPQHAQLREQLIALADLQFDAVWEPAH